MLRGRSIVPFAIVAIAVGIGLTRAAQRGEDGQIIQAGVVSAFEVRVGDCFDDEAFSSEEIEEIPAIPCTEPHDNEVYATFDLPGDAWPGEEEVEVMAGEGCYARFEASIGETYENSVIDLTTMYPSSSSWERGGDREVVCIAFDMNLKKLTGTVIGSGR